MPLPASEVVRLNKEYTLFEWNAQAAYRPIPVERARGVYFWDTDGKRYLDFNSQLMNVNIGHGDERVIHAIQEQAARLPYISPYLATEVRGLLGERLADITPGDLKRTFFTLGGTDANETAIKMARLITGRHKVLTRYRSYHGSGLGASTLTGDPRRWPVEPGLPGVIHFHDPHRYRCRWCANESACNLHCLGHLEDTIQYEGPQNIAAILIEPVTGTNGILIPPPGYLAGVRELCDRHGILLILDEVMSGFGRTGEWFAADHWGVAPDMMTMAKGLTCGYAPLGAVILSERIARHFDDHVLWTGYTYSAHALGCAAALACLQVYQEDDLIHRAKERGRFLAEQEDKLKEKHPSVGDVRHIGLFSLFELVRDRRTKEPLVPFNAMGEQMEPMNRLRTCLLDNGLFTFVRWNTFFVNPPLIITQEELAEGLAIIDRALDIADEYAR